ncbi:MAG: winged helix-turn-helix domain-containing protein [Parachlamydia sp.]|nr:winged helix-turn-helix domain-containing protein [Parachlamydia sp.]
MENLENLRRFLEVSAEALKTITVYMEDFDISEIRLTMMHQEDAPTMTGEKEKKEKKEVKTKAKGPKSLVSRTERQLNDRKNACKFFDECCEKKAASYISTADLHKKYLAWILRKKAGHPVRETVLGKYLSKYKNIRNYQTRALKHYASFYKGIAFKDRSIKSSGISVGELLKFFQTEIQPSNSAGEIAVDAIYHTYKSWCEKEDVKPVAYRWFYKYLLKSFPKKFFSQHDRTTTQCKRRWLNGHSVRNLIGV